MKEQQKHQPHSRSMLSFAVDPPNICTLISLFCALLGIYFAVTRNYSASIISMLWAVIFDWCDGMVARRMKGRSRECHTFGKQIDSQVDLVGFCVCPAVFLLSYGQFSPWFLPGAFIILSTGVIRLSYFNVYGLIDESTYMGLALDNNIIILAGVFLFEDVVGPTAFTQILYAVFMVLAALNIAPIRTPKLTGRWFYILVVYVMTMTAIHGWRIHG